MMTLERMQKALESAMVVLDRDPSSIRSVMTEAAEAAWHRIMADPESPDRMFERIADEWTAKILSVTRINSYSYLRDLTPKVKRVRKLLERATNADVLNATVIVSLLAYAVQAFDSTTQEAFDDNKAQLKANANDFNGMYKRFVAEYGRDDDSEDDDEPDSAGSGQAPVPTERHMRALALRMRMEHGIGARKDRPFATRVLATKRFSDNVKSALIDAFSRVSASCHASDDGLTDEQFFEIECLVNAAFP